MRKLKFIDLFAGLGGSHSPISFPTIYKLFAGLMVALSLLLLGLLRASASLWGNTLYRYPERGAQELGLWWL